ncbi:MAG: hypothetical protein EBW19_00320, partial [Betaproteobacteria bacterium]|nr:hypothetical protein [Betaproteobacteria bacterium]
RKFFPGFSYCVLLLIFAPQHLYRSQVYLLFVRQLLQLLLRGGLVFSLSRQQVLFFLIAELVVLVLIHSLVLHRSG